MSFLNYHATALFPAEAASVQPPPLSGRGVGIAFLDTGISPAADFIVPNNRIVAFRDFIGGKTQPYDDNGHGTHVTGLFLCRKRLKA